MLANEILAYADAHSGHPDAVLEEVTRSTHLHTIAPQMLSGKVQGGLLTLLTSLLGAEHVLEIGTFTGFGTICLARGLKESPESKVVTFESNPELSWLVQKHLKLAGVDHKVECVTGNALALIADRKETWDVVFIDANKQEYPTYFDLIIDRVRPGGLILTDNVLWSGKVVFEPDDVDAAVIRQYNDKLVADDRVEVLLLTIRDGISVARKK